MSPRRMIAAVTATFCLLALLGWSGCTGCSGKDAQAKAAATPPEPDLASLDAGSADDDDGDFDRELVPFYAPSELAVDTGKVDLRNRYSSAVRVYAEGIGKPEEVKLCSGVLVSPRLVLTAASCVCSRLSAPKGDGGQTLVDAEGCATIGHVGWGTYRAGTHDHPPGERYGKYDAAVRVYPGFKQVLDEQGNVVTSEADLAVFVLDKAAAYISPVELAETDVKAGESLVIVGHGYARWADLDRVFSDHRVTKVLGSGGRVAFAQPPPNLYKGARGGPCLRQTKQGPRLIGILSASVGQEALFTSVYPYRDWLRAEIQGAADAGSSMPQPRVSP